MGELVAIHVWHMAVGQQQGVGLRAQRLDRRLAIARDLGCEAQRGELAKDNVLIDYVVFGHEDELSHRFCLVDRGRLPGLDREVGLVVLNVGARAAGRHRDGADESGSAHRIRVDIHRFGDLHSLRLRARRGHEDEAGLGQVLGTANGLDDVGLLPERPSRTDDDDVVGLALCHRIPRDPHRLPNLPGRGYRGIPMPEVSGKQLPQVIVLGDQENVQASEIVAVRFDTMVRRHGQGDSDHEGGTLSRLALEPDRALHHLG